MEATTQRSERAAGQSSVEADGARRAAIDADGLRLTYSDGTEAVDGVDLTVRDVPRGERKQHIDDLLDRDAMTVVGVSSLGGTLDDIVPGIAVLVALDIASGAVAVYLLSRASSRRRSDVRGA